MASHSRRTDTRFKSVLYTVDDTPFLNGGGVDGNTSYATRIHYFLSRACCLVANANKNLVSSLVEMKNAAKSFLLKMRSSTVHLTLMCEPLMTLQILCKQDLWWRERLVRPHLIESHAPIVFTSALNLFCSRIDNSCRILAQLSVVQKISRSTSIF